MIQFVYFKISTAITCIIILALLYLFKNIIKDKINIKTILIITTLMSVAFVFFNASNTFAWYIVNFLHKDVGLNSRSQIWSKAVEIIFSSNKSLILGNGIYNDGNFINLYGLYWPAHNQLLEWLFEYGILGTGLLYFFFIQLDRTSKWGEDLFLIYSVCFAIFIGSISSGPLSTATGYMALCLLPHLDEFRRDAQFIDT